MVRLDRKSQRSFVEPGSPIQEAVPVVVMGELEPDDSKALKDGVGSRLRSQEGFYGPPYDTNPGQFVSDEVALTTDGGGAAAGALGTPTAGRHYRLIATWWRGPADAAGHVTIGPCGHVTDVVGSDPKPCNAVSGDGLDIAVAVTAAAAAAVYVAGATFRLEDNEVAD